MANNSQLCKSHITKLQHVSSALSLRQKMNYTQLILGDENTKRVEKAKALIAEAINILGEVK